MPEKVFRVLEKIDGFQFFAYDESKSILPQEFMILCNHQSLFDIPAFMKFMPEIDLRFIAKDALGRGVPLVSPMLKSQEHCLIPRSARPMESVKLISEFGASAKEKKIVPVLFPEGTRSRDGELRKFYSAGFRTLSEASGLPVVLCALDGGWKFAGLKGLIKYMHKGSYRIKVLKVYDSPKDKDSCQKILDESRELIQNQLNEWRAKPLMEK
jgi:1-acyl-sn-glycerol-3-phosphate acyltransferase